MLRPPFDSRAPVTAPPSCSLIREPLDPDQRRWFCVQCQLHVHHLSAMTRREAENVMSQTPEKRVCVSFFQDDEGKILFRPDRPPFRWLQRAATYVTSFVFTLLQVGGGKALAQEPSSAQVISPSPAPTITPSPSPVPPKNGSAQAASPQPSPSPKPKKPKPDLKQWVGFMF